MSGDIYGELRARLDQYSVGFGQTESGVELRILKKLFTEEEAQMYLDLTLDLQTAREVAEQIGQAPEKVEKILQRMMDKGLVFPRFPRQEGEPFTYAAAPFAHGILEHQVKRMDKELAELIEEYLKIGFQTQGPLPLRTVPVSAAIDPSKRVAPYDDVREILKGKDRICLTDCVCSIQHRLAGHECDQPLEICMLFDFYADYYVARGMGRWITCEEALAKLDECEQAGLVPQFSNSQNPEALCNCCPDCCGGLRVLKLLPQPGRIAASNYYAQVDPGLCTACGICVDRCRMDAITLDEKVAGLSRDQCIGCGLCVTECPEEALSLEARPEAERQVPPKRSAFVRPSVEFESRFRQE